MEQDKLPTKKEYRPGMECPYCHAKLTIREAITILNGTGYTQTAKVRTPDGETHFVEAGLANPLEVEIFEE
jgi:hypothetical protein